MNNQMEQEDNNHSGQEKRIFRVEDAMLEMRLWQVSVNTRLDDIKRKLDNGITTKLEKLSLDMAIILPVIQKELKKSTAVEIAVEIAIKTAVAGGVITFFGSLFIFLLKTYFSAHG